MNSHIMATEIGRFAKSLSWLKEFTKHFERGSYTRNYAFTICLEGPDKTGKTTTLDFLEAACEEFGINVMLFKMPLQSVTRELLMHDNGFSQFERTLIFLNDLVHARLLADVGDNIDLILMDRNPIYSTYVYTYPLLTDVQKNYITHIMQSNMDSYLLPDKTYLTLYPPYESDDTYAAKVSDIDSIYERYNEISRLNTLNRNMGCLYESPEVFWNDIPAPIALCDLGVEARVPVLYGLNRLLEDIYWESC